MNSLVKYSRAIGSERINLANNYLYTQPGVLRSIDIRTRVCDTHEAICIYAHDPGTRTPATRVHARRFGPSSARSERQAFNTRPEILVNPIRRAGRSGPGQDSVLLVNSLIRPSILQPPEDNFLP